MLYRTACPDVQQATGVADLTRENLWWPRFLVARCSQPVDPHDRERVAELTRRVGSVTSRPLRVGTSYANGKLLSSRRTDDRPKLVMLDEPTAGGNPC